MSFDRLARYYRAMEWVVAGGKLQRARRAFLEEAKGASEILLIGEGHGRFLPEVCRVNRKANITCVDASEGMLGVARERLREMGEGEERVQFRRAEILEFHPEGSFDLVVTHFFLDCFEGEELERVVGKISSMLAPGGRWVIADFQIPERGWKRVRARVVLAMAYAFFRAAVGLPARRLVSPERVLEGNGLVRKGRVCFDHELIYSEVWEKSGNLLEGMTKYQIPKTKE